ncbi:NAD-dependent protein deacetylase sirtuin-2 [Actinomortierella wolfii]|nr:NAD-dependent protein deacetylase sirtuin-2 [Actinomortierella wolfii]
MSSPGRTSIKAKAAMKTKEAPPARVPILKDDTLEAVADYIKQGKAKNVIIMAGAGISTAAGIKDFRSPGTGLYSDLAKYNLPYPEAVFDIDFFKKTPAPFYRLAKELYPGRYRPTLTHYFFSLLVKKGLVLRIYTQNIDSLERQAGIDGDMLVEAHGSFATSKCIQCSIDNIDNTFVKKHILRGEIPYCKRCGGLVKPAITFFGEDLPARFGMFRQDFPKCDLLIVLGTSLKVEPFNRLISRVKDNVPRLLINREKAGEDVYGGFDFEGKWSKKYQRDAFYGGDCDSGVRELAKLLGWDAELDALYQKGHELLKIAEEKEALELAAEGLRLFQDEDDETDEDKEEGAFQETLLVIEAEAELPADVNTSSTEKVAEAIDLIVSQLQQSSLAQQQSGPDDEVEPKKDGASDKSSVAKTESTSEPSKTEKDAKQTENTAEVKDKSSLTPAAKSTEKSPKDEAKGSCGPAEPESAVECVNTLSVPTPVVVQTPIPISLPMSASSTAAVPEAKALATRPSFASAYTPSHQSRASLSSRAFSTAAGSRRVSCPPIPSSPSVLPSPLRLAHASVHPEKSSQSQSIPSFANTCHPPTETLSSNPLYTKNRHTHSSSVQLSASDSTLVSLSSTDRGPAPTSVVAQTKGEDGVTTPNAIETNSTAGLSNGSQDDGTAAANTGSFSASSITAAKTTGTRTRTVSSPLATTSRPESSPPSSPSPPLSRPLSLFASLFSSPLADATNVFANQNVAYPSSSLSSKPSFGTAAVSTSNVSSSNTSMLRGQQRQQQAGDRQIIAGSGVESGNKTTANVGTREMKETTMDSNAEKENQKEIKKDAAGSILNAVTVSAPLQSQSPSTTLSVTIPHATTATATSTPTSLTAAAAIHTNEPFLVQSSAFDVSKPELHVGRTFMSAAATPAMNTSAGTSKSSNKTEEAMQRRSAVMSTKMETHKKRLRIHLSESDLLEGQRGQEDSADEDGHRMLTLSTPDGSLHYRYRRGGSGLGSGPLRHGSLSLSSSSSSSSGSSVCGPSLRRWTSAFPYLVGGPVQKKRRV